ncbi:pseudaminic acid synthase [Nocardioides sp. YIM 152315]|uniref:pseudaminic acid synthase n=1 Tax=Nocardioides sp. YIM 152315 TaxID=3031760 RepID=UPI0023DA3D6A|nr:pseudaminic acid synthase [Nocardioides sp. YIM 152315]MDF1604891.1 pseudaminic acid synthase [Nocardioides sp. YIM 152315]
MSKTQVITVNGRAIGAESPVFVIGEMSGNHNGSLDRALEIVDAIAGAGAAALKIQTYTADTLTIDVDLPPFRVASGHSLWSDRTLYDLYEEAHTPWEWHRAIFERARQQDLIPFSTPFDPTAVALLEELGVELYKTASAEIVDLPLMREIAATGKPMVVSTGMATLAEVDAAVNAIRGAGSSPIVLLACTAAYPADPAEARLGNIALLREAFDVPVGLSDHTPGVGVAVAAAALGAVAIEKHVTLDRADGGVDSEFSLNPDELAALVRAAEQARVGVRSGVGFGPTEEESTMLALRRSLYVVEEVRAGDEVSAANVRSIRPAGGLAPDAFDDVAGRRFTQDVGRGTPLTWDVL